MSSGLLIKSETLFTDFCGDKQVLEIAWMSKINGMHCCKISKRPDQGQYTIIFLDFRGNDCSARFDY